MTKCPGTAGAVLVFAAALAANAAPTAAQDVFASAGSSFYDSDAFCLNSSAFFTDFSVGVGGGMVGVSASYDNSDWPWPRPPGSSGGGGDALLVPAAFYLGAGAAQEQFYMTQGEALQATVEAYPLGILRRLTGERPGALETIDRFLVPYVGAGIHVSGDGETAEAGDGRDLPTFGLRGDGRPIVTYGARLFLPGRDQRIRLQLQYSGSTMFVDEFEAVSPGGETLRIESENLTWGNWSVGVSLRVGG
jgi:hypothetical protein